MELFQSLQVRVLLLSSCIALRVITGPKQRGILLLQPKNGLLQLMVVLLQLFLKSLHVELQPQG
jgi:hypothetical protein